MPHGNLGPQTLPAAFQRLDLVATLCASLETHKTRVVAAYMCSPVCVSRMDLVWCDGLL